jgi:hypothetical protein
MGLLQGLGLERFANSFLVLRHKPVFFTEASFKRKLASKGTFAHLGRLHSREVGVYPARNQRDGPPFSKHSHGFPTPRAKKLRKGEMICFFHYPTKNEKLLPKKKKVVKQFFFDRRLLFCNFIFSTVEDQFERIYRNSSCLAYIQPVSRLVRK